MTSGTILHLQRLSTEDGPGLRTTVFFKGCPLRCAWCHNPESLSPAPQTQWFSIRCIGCDTCIGKCPNGCLTRTTEGVSIDRARCRGCGTCAEACPSGALELLGRTLAADDLVSELAKDRAFYATSDGGVTLSGGEPTFQASFAEAVMQSLRDRGIPVALDTCGLCSRQTLERLIPLADLVLFDLKVFDPREHREWTGQTNQLILENLLRVRDAVRQANGALRLWIRTPLIPGATDGDENLIRIGEFMSQNVDGLIDRWELCAFNNLCRDQYRRLGIHWAFEGTPLMTAEEVERCARTARRSGVPAEIVVATGVTRPLDVM